MKDEQINSEKNIQEIPLTEGHRPEVITKGYQASQIGDLIAGGYKPDISLLNPQNPPQGGSGVPPIQASNQNDDKQ